MATTKSTEQTEDNLSVEKESMFRRMIRKLKKGSSEEDLDVGAKTMPTESGGTEPSLQEVKEYTDALQESLQDLQNIEKTSMFPRMVQKLKKESGEDGLDVGTKTKPTETGSTEPSLQEVKEYTVALLGNLQDLQYLFQKKQDCTSLIVRRLQEQTEENHKQENVILSEFTRWLEAINIMIQHLEETTQHRVSLKDQEAHELKAQVDEMTQERAEAAAKIKELEKRLVDQATNTQYQVSQKDQEIESLKARVAVLEAEKNSNTLQENNVLIDPRSILQEVQKIRKENEERTAHQQELVRKMRKQMEANKGFVKNLKQELADHIQPHGKVLKEAPSPKDVKNEEAKKDLCVPKLLLNGFPLPDTDQQKEAEKKAADVPKLLLNGVPLPDTEQPEEAKKKAAEVPKLLLNGFPLPDTDQYEEAEKKAADVPMLLLNGVPLPDTDQYEEAEKKAAEVPKLLLNGFPLPDTDQHEEAEKKAAEVPKLLLNGLPLPYTDQHEEAEKKAAEVPKLLLNGVPLPDTDQHEEAEKTAAEVPKLLLNGVPLPDTEQHEQAEKKTAESDKSDKLGGHCILDEDSPGNESEKEEETFEKGNTIPQDLLNTSLSSGDANIEPSSVNAAQERPRIPEFYGVHYFPRSLVAHRVPPHCTMDPVPLLVHFVPNDGYESGDIYYDLDSWTDAMDAYAMGSFREQHNLSPRRSTSPPQARSEDAMDPGLTNVHRENPYPARKSASSPAQACLPHAADNMLKKGELMQSPSVLTRESLESLSNTEFGGGDMEPQPTEVAFSWWMPVKHPEYQEFGEPNMSLLDFTAVDESRGLEVVIERKAPNQFWCAPGVVKGDEPRGLEIVLESSEHFVQQKAWQRCQLTDMLDTSSTNKMATASCQGKSMQVNKSPEGEDTVRDEPASFTPSFPLALLAHRVKRGYRLISSVLY